MGAEVEIKHRQEFSGNDREDAHPGVRDDETVGVATRRCSYVARHTDPSAAAGEFDLAILRKALSIAVGDELIEENVAMGIKPHPERRRDRVPNDDEMRAVLEAIDSVAIRPQAALLFKLLIFTGCRAGEWRTAEWTWVDLPGGVLRLPDAASKAGARTVALSSVVQAFLATSPRVSRFVIPNNSGAAPLPSWSVNDAWETVRRATNISDLNVHDLRHAYATRGAGLGATAIVLRDALGHKTMSMTGRYIAHQTDPVRELAERIGAQI